MDQPPPPAVEEVVVRATRLPSSPGEAAFDVVRLPLATVQASERTDEALKQVPGASLFRRSSSLSANPTTQGLSFREIAPSGAGRALVTLDGVPLNDPFGGWVIWSQVPPLTLSGISIVRGGGAGPYGAGALTGVAALEERPGRPGEISAEGAVGQRGSVRGAAVGDLAAGPGDLLLAAAGETTQGWFPVRDGRGAADTALSLRAETAAARWQADLGGGVLALRGGLYRETRGSGLAGAASQDEGGGLSATFAQVPAAGRYGWRLQAWARQSGFSQNSVTVAPGRTGTTPANSQDSTPAAGYALNAALRRAEAGCSWELGADARFFRGDEKERFRFMAGDYTRDRLAGGDAGVAGVYLEGSRTAGPWLFAGGARLDGWRDWNGRRIERDRATGAVTLDERPPDRGGLAPTARAGIRREFADGLYLRTATYAGFRPPTLNELHRPFRVGNDVTESDPALEPERLYGVEVAAGGSGANGSLDLTLYAARLDDAVTNVTIGFGPGTFPRAGFIPAGGVLRMRQNAGRVDALGLELDGSRALTPSLTVQAALSATDARVDGGAQAPQLTGLRPAQAPIWTATAGLDWTPSPRFELDVTLRYESKRYEDDLNSRILDPAVGVDARAQWRVNRAAALFFAIDNLFDADIQTGRSADGVASLGEPRTIWVGVRIDRR